MSHEPTRSQVQRVMEVGGAMTTIANPEAMRRHILETTVQMLDAATGSLYMVDPVRGDLYFDVALGHAGALLKHAIRLKKGEGLAGSVMESGQTEVVNDVAADPRHATRVDSMTGFTVQHALTVPLAYGDTIIGVLQILNKQGEVVTGFTDEDVWIAEMIGRFVAVALERSRERTEFEQEQVAIRSLLGSAIGLGDPSTSADHGARVAGIVRGVAARLGLDDSTIENLRLAGLLHDVGKIGLPFRLPPHDQPIDDAVREAVKDHARLGAEMVAGAGGYEETLAPSIRHQHERWDGSGYPDGLAGEDIPLGGRVLSVADSFEIMTNASAYGPTLPPKEAIESMRAQAGSSFDPRVVEALASAYRGGDLRHIEGLSPA